MWTRDPFTGGVIELAFDESEHERGSDGKFTSESGSSIEAHDRKVHPERFSHPMVGKEVTTLSDKTGKVLQVIDDKFAVIEGIKTTPLLRQLTETKSNPVIADAEKRAKVRSGLI